MPEHLGSLKGTGLLHVGDHTNVPVHYDISVTMDMPSNIKSAGGVLWGPLKDLTKAIFQAEHKVLDLQSGGSVEVFFSQVISDISRGEYARIEVSGPVPGF